jgi:hypothetical protein
MSFATKRRRPLQFLHGCQNPEARSRVNRAQYRSASGSPTEERRRRASLTTPVTDLEASDWRPFRTTPAQAGAWLMVGHVAVACALAASAPGGIDRTMAKSIARLDAPARPASQAAASPSRRTAFRLGISLNCRRASPQA